ncbi:hypothetical protein [Aquisalimonas asiatica]|uniref:O-antigen ligase like membrane protein n=1 Tax=Aquisalimonas asiatica TaxID=406100 RepID=A0A1H8SP98_9GAMM|nr:hypothetical protein [Aquisalimonas asiatica]SEO80395.1 hypothetical protein SAMN04488052_103105 [Aquisalimonas asiatica]
MSALRLCSTVSFSLALTFIFSMGVVLTSWAAVGFFWYLCYLVAIFTISIYFFAGGEGSRKGAALCFLVFLYVLWLVAPFRTFDEVLRGDLIFVAVAAYCFLPVFWKLDVGERVRRLVGIVGLAVVPIWVGLVAGLDVPWIEVVQDFREDDAQYYRLYPGTVVLSSQVFHLAGADVFRASGLFREPGHFAIICSLLLAVNSYRIRDKYDFGLLLGGVLSFSVSFFFLLLFFFLCTVVERVLHGKGGGGHRKGMVFFAMLTSLVVLLFLASIASSERVEDSGLADRVLYGHLQHQSITGILDARVRGDVEYVMDGMSDWDRMVGVGSHALERFDVRMTDLRGKLVKHGYIGIGMCLVLYGYLIWLVRPLSVQMFLFGVLVIVLLHRAWMVDQAWFLFLFIFFAVLGSERRRRGGEQGRVSGGGYNPDCPHRFLGRRSPRRSGEAMQNGNI